MSKFVYLNSVPHRTVAYLRNVVLFSTTGIYPKGRLISKLHKNEMRKYVVRAALRGVYRWELLPGRLRAALVKQPRERGAQETRYVENTLVRLGVGEVLSEELALFGITTGGKLYASPVVFIDDVHQRIPYDVLKHHLYPYLE